MLLLIRLFRFRTGGGFVSDDDYQPPIPIEAVFLRGIGLLYLAVFVISTVDTHPRPGLHGRGLAILAAGICFVIAAVAVQPRNFKTPVWQRVASLLVLTALSGVLAVLQPNGIWEAGPYLVGVMAALRLERLAGALTIVASLVILMTIALIEGRGESALSVLGGVLPWFLIMRMMRESREQTIKLAAAKDAQAQAAAAAERGRLAREMHDVLAHSLSALALKLETTRLLARERKIDADVIQALDQSHHLAALGLEEARRAIAAARGDDLPGPERLGDLAEAFGEQSGLPVAVNVQGNPRELAPDARLALYRTAQEALTNVRRHATPERVEVRLDYLPDATVLVVEDRALAPTPPASVVSGSGSGYGLTGMRERAELLGGRLVAEPTAAGFRVELWLPTEISKGTAS